MPADEERDEVRLLGPSYWTDRTGFDQVIEDRDMLAAEVERLRAELAAMNAERDAIIERIEGLNDGESLLHAIGFMVVEWEHFGRELRRACDETIPTLTAERDAALAEVARLTAAGIEPSAERALVTSAEAYRLVTEAKDMQQLADEARRQTARLTEAILDAMDCLKRVVDGGQPFTLSQREEVRLSMESLSRALAATSTQPGDRRAGDAGS